MEKAAHDAGPKRITGPNGAALPGSDDGGKGQIRGADTAWP